MKAVLLALPSLLCAPPIWAAEYSEHSIKSSPEKIVVDSRESGQVAKILKTPKTFPLVGGIDGLTVQPDKLISSVPEMIHVAQNATSVPTPRPDTVSKEMPSEAIDQNKENNKGKDKNNGKPVADKEKEVVFKEMVVTGEIERDSHYTSPSTRVTRAQIERQNAQTTEEVLKYQPSLQIRQRYVGDPNGVLGIRGADMFSTARNMVFADGLPLHNQLQATFNGAPRWSMVGPNEIDAVDIVYGPFSAEYSSNSIGGVVNIKTRMPRKREFYVESSLFVQTYNNYGPDKGNYMGNREYVSYGDRFKDALTVFASYNRLNVVSQPMTYLIDNTGLNPPGGSVVSGGIRTPDTRGTPSIIYGDTGPERVNTDLFKVKLGYDINPELQTIFTAAYEVRTRNNNPRDYLTGANGQPFWGGGTPNNATFDGSGFDVVSKGFGAAQDKRETLNLGLGLRGAITRNWNIDTTVSYFDVLKDQRGTAFSNIQQPGGDKAGQLQNFNNFNWLNADLKLTTKELFGNNKLPFLYGYHFDQYNLGFQQFAQSNYAAGIGILDPTKNNAGQTSTHAAFAQLAYKFLPDFDATVGLRQEFWSASNGFVGNAAVPDRNISATTPKFSLGYEPGPWKLRYSFGRTHRFPVIAELFQSLSTTTQILQANAQLRPENGVHHNFMIEYGLPRGYIRVNVFRDDIKDAIQQVLQVSGIFTKSTFLNIDQTSTTGVEFIFDQRRILGSKFDFNFNGTWMNAKVDKGPLLNFTEASGVNDPFNLTGKQRIRLPHWRANFFTTYNATEVWDLTLGGRYTSDSFNDLDNKDFVNHVFGAQSGFFFLDFKTNYRFKLENGLKSRVSFGVTNLTNDQAYVFHPYPQRTYLVEAAFSF